MALPIKSIRPFIGARDFNLSRRFYTDVGFEERALSPQLSVFKSGDFGFYLQDAYLAEWVDNTMVFLEVEDVDQYYNQLAALHLTASYPSAKLLPVSNHDWGKECFLYDPSGILRHIGEFAQ